MIDTKNLTPTVTALHASKLIGCSVATVASRCKSGILGCYKSGGWQIPKESLEAIRLDIRKYEKG